MRRGLHYLNRDRGDSRALPLRDRRFTPLDGSALELDRSQLAPPLLDVVLALSHGGLALGERRGERIERCLAAVELAALGFQSPLDVARQGSNLSFAPLDLRRRRCELGGPLVEPMDVLCDQPLRLAQSPQAEPVEQPTAPREPERVCNVGWYLVRSPSRRRPVGAGGPVLSRRVWIAAAGA